ncbi:MAG TPA: ABC transporter permease, partial [Chryseolinea sp.]|nr:ABC transporter permease [Chryseolinea sp.]
MFNNFLKTSVRNLLRHKTYTCINVLGLTVGLVTSIFILVWIIDELAFDNFHSNNDRIFKVLVNNTYPDGKIETYPATPSKLKDVIVQEIPEVELAAHHSYETELLVKHEANSYNEVGIYADPTLFKIFSFPIVRGNETKPLIDIKSIAISEKLAEKLFKNDDPIGKSLNLGATHELIVTSVFADVPQHSTLQFDFVASFELFIKENPWTQHWKSGGTQTAVLLKSPAFDEIVNRKFIDLIKNNCPDCSTVPFLFPYAKSRLYNEFENGKSAGGRIQQIYLFGAVAILILMMACINFTNLSTARAVSRSREVGVRKSMGAQK